MKTVRDYDFTGKRVLLRMDLDVPIADGEVVDDYRLEKAVPTIKQILRQCEQLIIIGHAGRPGGKYVEELSLAPVAKKLSRILGEEVEMAEESSESRLIMLENLRFKPGEEKNDMKFAAALASLADIYVNEAFAVSHREHASIVSVPKLIHGCIGYQFEQELKHLILDNAEKPIVVLLGGAKLHTKLPAIEHLLTKVDEILLGGAMIFTFYKAEGLETGTSLVDEEYLEHAKELLGEEKITLPVDVVVAPNEEVLGRTVGIAEIPKDQKGLDLGPETIQYYKEKLQKAKTILWNGPLGYCENKNYARATNDIARFMAGLNAKTIIGGGDTVAVVDKLGLIKEYDHVSTGGGASLMLLEGKELPALKALE